MRRRSIILYVIILILGGVAYGVYQFNRKPASLDSKKADVVMTASELLVAFQDDEAAANEQYLDKVVAVKGIVSDITDEAGVSSIYLETDDPLSSVICEMEKSPVSGVNIGDEVSLKGQCTGFLMDIVLVKTVIQDEE